MIHIILAIPRLKLRRKSASDTLRPLFTQLGHALQLSSSRASRDEGRATIAAVSHLVNQVIKWAKNTTTEEDFVVCKVRHFCRPQIRMNIQ
jgi:hypothetical protein